MLCNQCEALVINGVLCHETGCPNAWKRKRECKECGTTFVPGNRYQDCCSDSCNAACYGLYCEED
jgi:hypothetical protein